MRWKALSAYDLLLRWRDMACTHKSVWYDHRCWVSAIATTTAEALSLGSPWKRNWALRIVPPYRRSIFHCAKGHKCRKWEKTPVGNGMWIYSWRRRLVFLLLAWWVRSLPGVLISLRQKRIGDCPLTLLEGASQWPSNSYGHAHGWIGVCGIW